MQRANMILAATRPSRAPKYLALVPAVFLLLALVCSPAASAAAAPRDSRLLDRRASLAPYVTSSSASLVEPLRDATVPPSKDAFYAAPSNLSCYVEGQVIRSRQVTTLTTAKAAYQVMYRTNDRRGQAQAGVTTTLVPRNASVPARLVGYAAFEDSTAFDCAPSWAMVAGTKSPNTALSLTTQPLADVLLSLGYTVTVPDYLGPDSAFIVGRQQGQSMLDALRATLSHPVTVPRRDAARVDAALLGYSGGASAVAWAAQLQPDYAPELSFLGASYGGLPVSPLNVLNKINGGPNAGLSFGGMVGMANVYPELEAYLQANLNDAGRQALQRLRSGEVCLASKPDELANVNLTSLFHHLDFSEAPIPDILRENTLGNATPSMPLYIFQGLSDEIMPVEDVDAFVSSQCASGARITYSRDEMASHGVEMPTSLLGAVVWLDGRYNDYVAARSSGECLTRTQPWNLGPPVPLEQMLGPALGSLDAVSRLLSNALGDGLSTLLGAGGLDLNLSSIGLPPLASSPSSGLAGLLGSLTGGGGGSVTDGLAGLAGGLAGALGGLLKPKKRSDDVAAATRRVVSRVERRTNATAATITADALLAPSAGRGDEDGGEEQAHDVWSDVEMLRRSIAAADELRMPAALGSSHDVHDVLVRAQRGAFSDAGRWKGVWGDGVRLPY